MLGIEYQKVDDPLVASTCPAVPVALFESRNSPVIRNLSIVEEARYERPVAVKLVVTVFVVVEFPTTRFVMFAKLATRDATKELVLVLLIEVRLVKNPLVELELPKVELFV